MQNKVTIHDLAKALNVNASTISRALNDSPRVTQRTKDKVLAKANELGYQRNVLASNLRKNQTHTIGVIVPRISRHFFSSAISGIEETAYKSGFNVMICQSLESLEREQTIIDSMIANRVAGVLLSVSMETLNYDHLSGLKKNGIPIIFFDRHCEIPGYSNVIIDDFQSGFNATEHLIKNGCKRIAHFSGPGELKIYQNRFRGYLAALNHHHIPYLPELVISSRLMEKDGYESAKALLASNLHIDGLFAANDVSAIGAMKYLKEKGVKIPEDIAIVGFSNEPLSEVIEPSLTTIDQSGNKIGALATDLLLKQIKNKSIKTQEETITLKTSLITRKSSQRSH